MLKKYQSLSDVGVELENADCPKVVFLNLAEQTDGVTDGHPGIIPAEWHKLCKWMWHQELI